MTYIGGKNPMLEKSQERQERIEAQFRDHVVSLVVAAIIADQPVTKEMIPEFVSMVAIIHKESEKHLELDR